MAKFRKRPVIVEATQWFKNGDHPDDGPVGTMIGVIDDKKIERIDVFLGEGKIVRYYRTPMEDGGRKCQHCGQIMHVHGWIDTLEGGHIVCPSDWIVTGIKGERWPVKDDIFKMTYEEVK